MTKTGKFFFSLVISGLLGVSALAQETQTKVVDEVVAQVNDGVITLSRIKREMKDIVDAEVAQGKKREDVQKQVEEKQGEMIANLINEELLIQKAKEMGLENDVEVAINQRIAELMKQYNLKTVEALYAEMEKSGVSPTDLKETWRKQITRERVIQQEIQSKLYWRPTGKDLKDYYDKNRGKFTKQETISFSELFLGFAGRDEAAVREKAKQLLAQLRSGGDWAKIVKENTDTPVVTQGVGKAEKLKVAAMPEILSKPLVGVKVGGYTEPIEADQLGVAILRVDEREQASNESVFDESAVRLAMLNEGLPTAQKDFFTKLRADAYIKISDTYRPIVSPVLFADERKDKSNE